MTTLYTPEKLATLSRAFDVVKPATHWKDAIHAYITARMLEAANVTLTDVVEAIVHYTATEATVIEHTSSIYEVKALGYRAGPAGG